MLRLQCELILPWKMWIEQCLLSLLVFIGLHQADGLRQGQLYSVYENRDYTPQYEYHQTQDDWQPRLQLNNDMITSDGSDDSDSRRFLLLSKETKPNSEKFKLSELAFLGMGPNGFFKTEEDPETNSKTVSTGVEYFGSPIGQVSSTKTKVKKKDGTTVDKHKLENSYDFFGIPLGKIIYTDEKQINSHGEELPSSNEKAQFEIFGIPIGNIPLSVSEEHEAVENDDDDHDVTIVYNTATNEDKTQYESEQNQLVVKPIIVPVGYETGYHQVVYPPSIPATEQEYLQHGYEGYYQDVIQPPQTQYILSSTGEVGSGYEGGYYQEVIQPPQTQYILSSTGEVGSGYEGGYYQEVIQPPQTQYILSSTGEVGSGYEGGYYRQIINPPRQPHLVPIGTVKSHEGGDYHRVIRPSSRSLEGNDDRNRQQEIRTRPTREQLAMDNQNSRRFFLPGNSDVGKKFTEPIVNLFTGGMIGNGSNKGKRRQPKTKVRRPKKKPNKVRFTGPVIVG